LIKYTALLNIGKIDRRFKQERDNKRREYCFKHCCYSNIPFKQCARSENTFYFLDIGIKIV